MCDVNCLANQAVNQQCADAARLKLLFMVLDFIEEADLIVFVEEVLITSPPWDRDIIITLCECEGQLCTLRDVLHGV